MKYLNQALLFLLLTLPVPALAEPPPAALPLVAQEPKTDAEWSAVLREFYTKHEYRIPMRDGVLLHTDVFTPKDRSHPWPVLLSRTPYAIGPYGVDNTPVANDGRWQRNFSPSPQLLRHGFIFVHQDVRGKMMSEGQFVDVRPVVPHGAKHQTDESTDAWDTIDWLVKNIANNNGKVGIWGVSYPGFYAAQAAIDAHPALKAVSPQAPVTEWFLGDDFHHNGALFLADALLFYADFGKPRAGPTTRSKWEFDPETGDLYDFFLRLGPLANANLRYLKNEIVFWNEMMAHPTRDAWWQARDPRPFYKAVKPAVLTVGGWYDAEDLFGSLETYRAFETQSPGAKNALVIGPWRHGGWSRTEGDALGDIQFGAKTSLFYKDKIITPFFLYHLKGIGPEPNTEAWMFETGTNEWHTFAAWPPKEAKRTPLWLAAAGKLATSAPTGEGADSYVSDPAKPVPYRERMSQHRAAEYMTEDQRFAARRPDVLVYATEVLTESLTLAGPIDAELQVTISGTDADFVVKIIDVLPENAQDPEPNPKGVRMGGYQSLVRAEVMRGRFRSGFDKPTPFTPGEPAVVKFRLPDILHTFRTGHRLMVQVQSSWFPLVDRNPQTFVDIGKATEADFKPATIQILRGKARASSLTVGVLRGAL